MCREGGYHTLAVFSLSLRVRDQAKVPIDGVDVNYRINQS